jgi:siroheme synthase-like protein
MKYYNFGKFLEVRFEIYNQFVDLLPQLESNKLFPIFLKLEFINILVVGGGNVALEKMSAIKKADKDAKVQLIGKDIIPELFELVNEMPNVIIYNREFENSDIVRQNLVISATDNKALQLQIKKVCEEKNILCNVADTPDLCDFYLSSVVQKGNLKIAISTNGKSPTLAKRIKEFLEESIPDEIDDLLLNMNNLRKKLSGNFEEKVIINSKVEN